MDCCLKLKNTPLAYLENHKIRILMSLPFQSMSSVISVLETHLDDEDGGLPADAETCLALNRAYQEIIAENLKKVEMVLAHNKDKQVFMQIINLYITSNIFILFQTFVKYSAEALKLSDLSVLSDMDT